MVKSKRTLLRLLAGLMLVTCWLCRPAPAAAQTVFRVILVNGVLRGYYLHVPPGYDPENPVPLVLLFHARGSDGARFEGNTQFSVKADLENFIVVYPNALGEPKAWSVPWSPRQGGDPEDDLAFIAALFDRLTTNFTIDPARIYVAGMSSGAAMAQFVASRLSERVAAGASVAGAAGSTILGVYREAAPPEYPLSFLLIHGTADDVVPYYGGRGKVSPLINWVSAAYSTRLWVRANRCYPKPITWVSEDETVIVDLFQSWRTPAEVALITVVGGIHEWQLLGPDLATADVVWEFFLAHPRK